MVNACSKAKQTFIVWQLLILLNSHWQLDILDVPDPACEP